jgi:hypothetical protein
MRWPFQKSIETRIVQSFERGWRLIQVSLYSRLTSQYSATMPEESAGILAAQVVNYLKGDDIAVAIQTVTEPLKSEIGRIADQIPVHAASAMLESHSTREVIVGTLRMREILKFMTDGEAYMRSDEHQRIFALLSPYGPEFPEEIKPDSYVAMAERYTMAERYCQAQESMLGRGTT